MAARTSRVAWQRSMRRTFLSARAGRPRSGGGRYIRHSRNERALFGKVIRPKSAPSRVGSQQKYEKPRAAARGFWVFLCCLATGGGCPFRSCPPQNLSLALGALAIHRPRLEAAFFQPALDLVFGEADV